MFGPANAAEAKSLNAGFLLNEMNEDQQVSYISGVIEGLAYSRFLAERPSEAGMQCAYNWYYGEENRWPKIRALLKRHEDKPVGVLVHVLINKHCGG